MNFLVVVVLVLLYGSTSDLLVSGQITACTLHAGNVTASDYPNNESNSFGFVIPGDYIFLTPFTVVKAGTANTLATLLANNAALVDGIFGPSGLVYFRLAVYDSSFHLKAESHELAVYNPGPGYQIARLKHTLDVHVGDRLYLAEWFNNNIAQEFANAATADFISRTYSTDGYPETLNHNHITSATPNFPAALYTCTPHHN